MRHRCGVTGAARLFSVVLLVFGVLDVAGAPASADNGSLSTVATLNASDGAPGESFPAALAVSGSTLVAGAPTFFNSGPGVVAGAAYVFTQPAGGWTNGVQAAKLVSPGPVLATQSFGSQVAVSGSTVAVGPSNQGGVGYVFSEPAGGWAGTLTPSAFLSPSDGAGLPGGFAGFDGPAVSGPDVFAPEFSGTAEPGPLDVFPMPAAGWAGTVREAAKLVSPSGAGLGGPIVFSGRTVFAETGFGYDFYALSEPAGGWSGTVKPSATLVVPANVNRNGATAAVSGRTLVLGFPEQIYSSEGVLYVYSEPRGGWVGNIKPVAVLKEGFGVGGAGDGVEGLGAVLGVSGGLVVAADAYPDPDVEHGCPCDGSVYEFSKPPGGWSGTVAAEPAGGISESNQWTGALSPTNLFLGLSTPTQQLGPPPGFIGVANPQASPDASAVSITGLAHNKPRLRLSLDTGGNVAAVRSFSIRLPKGLSFARDVRRLKRGITLTGVSHSTLQLSHGRLTVTVRPLSTMIRVAIGKPAVIETPSLRKLHTGKRAKHAPTLTTTILIAANSPAGRGMTQVIQTTR